MRYDPALDFYTQEDVDRLKVLDVETNDAGLLGDLRTYTAKMLEARSIFEAIDLRYVESRLGNDKLILEDVNRILAQAEKEDFIGSLQIMATPIKDDTPIVVENLKNDTVREAQKAADEKRAQEAAEQDNYRGCMEFFEVWLRLPITAAYNSYEDEEKRDNLYNKILVLLDQRVREWYPKPLKDYMAVYSGRPVGALAYLDTTHHKKSVDKISNVNTYFVDGVELTTKVVIKSGVNVAKVFLFLVAEFTEISDNFSINNSKISASVSDYARYCGKDITKHSTSTPEEAAAEAKRVKSVKDQLIKDIKKGLQNLYDISFSVEGEGLTAKTRIISNYVVKGDDITVTFDPDLAARLSKKEHTMTQLPTAIFSVPATDPNAFHIMYKLTVQYNMDSNRERKAETYNFIGVKSLLAVAALPSFEEVQKKDRGHWERRIKEPFEEILDRLVTKYHFLAFWEYRHEKKQKVTDEDLAGLTDFKEWRDHYYILFEPVKKIDHKERITRKKERIAHKMKNKKKKSQEKS